MTSGTLPSSPSAVSDRARVLTQAVAEAARRLDLGSVVLASVIGGSQSTASRLLNGKYLLSEKSKEWEMAAHLVRLYRSLSSLVENDDLAKAWLHSANNAPSFAGRTPAESIKTAVGLIHAVEYLDAHRAIS